MKKKRKKKKKERGKIERDTNKFIIKQYKQYNIILTYNSI